MSNSTDADTKGKSPIEDEMPNFSIGLTQTEFAVDCCTKSTPISTERGECKAITTVQDDKIKSKGTLHL